VQTTQYIVFSDLDATLLDHHDYSFDAAKPALEKLKSLDIPVVLNSSKTMPEMYQIRAKMGNEYPFIVENGAAMINPPNYFENTSGEVINFFSEYAMILKSVYTLKEKGFQFRSFDMLSAKEVSDLTGLSEAGSKMAKQRFGSEPLLWEDTEKNLQLFTQAIHAQGLKLIKGGRFHHVIGLFDKGQAIDASRAFFEKKYPNKQIVTIGLGDSPNDLAMLETVDISIVIKSGRSTKMKLNNTRAIFSTKEGPAGWNEEILKLLATELPET
jgi:mannosyl-3-phosphoglycerate phosphatase